MKEIITYRLEIKMEDGVALSVRTFKKLEDAEEVAREIAQEGWFYQNGAWGKKKVTGLAIHRVVESEEDISPEWMKTYGNDKKNL